MEGGEGRGGEEEGGEEMGKMRVIPSPCPGSLKDLEFFRQHEISEKNMQCFNSMDSVKKKV